jgi:DNA-binding transcriptional regulator YhcF (GntR family)
LEHEGVLELRHGSGAFIRESAGRRARILRNAHSLVREAIERLASLDLTDDELRRVLDDELAQARTASLQQGGAKGKA